MQTLIRGAVAATVLLTAAVAIRPALAAAPTPASSQSTPSGPTAEPTRVAVTSNGLVGDLYLPAGAKGRRPAVLVLGGSEGGLKGSTYEARALAQRGYVALAAAYFGAPGVPDQLMNIPLEYFQSALNFLAARPDVDPQRLGVMGTSKGGEAALLVASAYPQVRVVVAGVPSSVAWPGIDTKDRSHTGASWMQNGKPVAFVPYDMSQPFTSIHDLYARSLASSSAHPDAAITVERIKGPVMLVCGEADTLWPSCEMSDVVAARLKSRGFRYEVVTLHYARAGHAAFGLPIPEGNSAKAMLLALGGDADGNETARVESWARAMAFLDGALKP